MKTPNQMKAEKSNNIKRSPLWDSIYEIVKQIPTKNVKGDAMDAPSAATEIEILFKESHKEEIEKAFIAGCHEYMIIINEEKDSTVLKQQFKDWIKKPKTK